MNAVGMADGSVVPTTWANKAATAVAESGEGREPLKGRLHTVVDAPASESGFASFVATCEARQVTASRTSDRLTQWRSRMS